MAIVTQQNAPVINRRSLEFENDSFVADSPIILPAVEVYDPPRPLPDAKGSVSNAELRELAKKNQPPQSWFEGEEEQLF
jgi:hypothetical protein